MKINNDNEKYFDLNIGKILENWKIEDAIRELIANAIDEQILSSSKEIEIFQDSEKNWHIRDYGRGINKSSFIQDENKEKLSSQRIIGRFGIGLKDALATFQRNNVQLTIESKYLFVSGIEFMEKPNFPSECTLALKILSPKSSNFEGTEIVLYNVKNEDMLKAKSLFLKFNNNTLLSETKKGQIFKKQFKIAQIYVNGLKISEENDFLFDYNITDINTALKKGLNRERKNVGKSAYSEQIKKILLDAILLDVKNETIYKILEDEFKDDNNNENELQWIDIKKAVYQSLIETGKYVSMTKDQFSSHPHYINDIQNTGKEIIWISSKLLEHIGENSSGTFNDYLLQERLNFQFNYVDYCNLTKKEKEVFDKTEEIIKLSQQNLDKIKLKNINIRISETMQRDSYNTALECLGVWIHIDNTIVIKRSQLKSLENYAGTLLHELTHAISGHHDSTREFENELTKLIGTLVNAYFKPH